MTDISCSYGDARDEALVAFLYDETDGNPAERDRFAAHLPACARCRADIATLGGVRSQLARWSPPEPSFAVISHQSSVVSQSAPGRAWWQEIPVWAQVAAAMLFLGVSAGIANLDVHYDQSGLSVRTGWSQRADRAGRDDGAAKTGAASGGVARNVSSTDAPWKTDLAALESQLKNEMRAAQSSSPAAPAAVRTVSLTDTEVNRRVRALVEESEKRQQRELALRVAELLRDVNAQRQADLVKIDRTLGVVQNNVGIEVMRNRQQIDQMNVAYRASQRQ